MKLAIFGGTGKTGKLLVTQALEAGHDVVLLARTPSKMDDVRHERLQVLKGDILEADCVDKTIQGADAVISTLAPSNNKPTFIISQGMDNILAAMHKYDVQRLVISTGAGIRDPHDKPKVIDRVAGFLLRVLAKNVAADMQQSIDKVRQSGLEWIIVRVPMLTDQPSRGSLKVGYVGDITPRLSRTDMATFMLQQVTADTYIRKAPAISN